MSQDFFRKLSILFVCLFVCMLLPNYCLWMKEAFLMSFLGSPWNIQYCSVALNLPVEMTEVNHSVKLGDSG